MSPATLLLPLLAFAAALALSPVAARIARRVGAVDEPGGRRRHSAAIPRFGGLAVFVAVAASLAMVPFVAPEGRAMLAPLLGPRWWWTAAGGLAAVAVGALDDLRPLGAWTKLGGQVLAAWMAVLGGWVVTAVTDPISGTWMELGALAAPLTVAWIVLVMNALNLIDGLDGLAAGVCAIVCGTVVVLAGIDGRPESALLASIPGAAALGFLRHNWHPASVFLGDSGSLFLGYCLAVLSMQGLQKGPTATLLLAPMLALGLPLFDTAATVVRRAARSGLAGILTPDAAHVHHRLVDIGYAPRRAVLLLYVACAAFGLAAIAVRSLHGAGQGLLVAAVAAAVYAATRKLGYVGRRGERDQ